MPRGQDHLGVNKYTQTSCPRLLDTAKHVSHFLEQVQVPRGGSSSDVQGPRTVEGNSEHEHMEDASGFFQTAVGALPLLGSAELTVTSLAGTWLSHPLPTDQQGLPRDQNFQIGLFSNSHCYAQIDK